MPETRLCVDLVIVAVDWVSMVLVNSSEDSSSTDPNVVRMSKSLRFARIVNGVRLVRLIKVPLASKKITDLIHSERLVIVLGIGYMCGSVLIVAHVIACGFSFVNAAKKLTRF